MNKKRLWLAGLIAAVVISGGFSIFAYHYLLKPQGTFGWDESHHASYGIIVAYSAKIGDWGTFWGITHRQMLAWPFLHSWILAAGLHAFGFSFIGARLTSLIFFFFSVPIVYLIGSELNGKKSILTGLIAVLFYASSPLILYYSTGAMIELPGLFFTLLISYLYFQGLKKKLNRYFFLAGFFAAILFLTKYQYGLIVLLALLIDGVMRFLKSGKAELKFPILIVISFALVIGIWLISSIPDLKIKSFIHTLKESGSHKPPLYFSSLDMKIFYLRSMASYYSASILVFLALLPGFFYSVYKLRKSYLRFLIIYPAVNLLLIIISVNKQDRYCITAMPFLFILGAYFLTEVGARLRKKSFRITYAVVLLIIFSGDIYKFPLFYRQVPNRIHSGGGRITWMENQIDYSLFYKLLKLPTILQQPAFYLNPKADYSAPKHNWQDVWDYIYGVIDRKGSLCCLVYHQRFSPHMLRWYSYAYGVPVYTSWEPGSRFFAAIIIDPLSVYYTEEGKRMAESRNREWNAFLKNLETKGLIKVISRKYFPDIGVEVKIFERT